MRARFLKDESGATMVEMTIVFTTLLILTFGLVEFGFLFWQWNSAEKATQLGARKAVVTTPVSPGLATYDCGSGSDLPGTPCRNVASYPPGFGTITCQSSGCTSGGFSATPFSAVVTEMQRVFPLIQPQNVIVEYRDIGLGFAGREGPVGAVTVGLTGMTFNFFALGALLGLDPIAMPDFRATLSTEDLSSAGA